MSEHGCESPAADIVRLGLTALVTTDGRELSNGLQIRDNTANHHNTEWFLVPADLKQPGVCVAGVSPGEEIIKVLLTEDELNPLDVVRVLRPPRSDKVHLVVIQRLHGLQHFPEHKEKSVGVDAGGGGG